MAHASRRKSSRAKSNTPSSSDPAGCITGGAAGLSKQQQLSKQQPGRVVESASLRVTRLLNWRAEDVRALSREKARRRGQMSMLATEHIC